MSDRLLTFLCALALLLIVTALHVLPERVLVWGTRAVGLGVVAVVAVRASLAERKEKEK